MKKRNNKYNSSALSVGNEYLLVFSLFKYTYTQFSLL